jgi:hypothetical protein
MFTPSADGSSLGPYPSGFVQTIGNELKKLAFKIAIGRSWMGMISLIRDLGRTLAEDFAGFRPSSRTLVPEYESAMTRR